MVEEPKVEPVKKTKEKPKTTVNNSNTRVAASEMESSAVHTYAPADAMLTGYTVYGKDHIVERNKVSLISISLMRHTATDPSCLGL